VAPCSVYSPERRKMSHTIDRAKITFRYKVAVLLGIVTFVAAPIFILTAIVMLIVVWREGSLEQYATVSACGFIGFGLYVLFLLIRSKLILPLSQAYRALPAADN
jgi:hypothetical protein